MYPAINGWIKTSTCDYPGTITTVVFTQGCPLKCVFCYNTQQQPIIPPSQNTEKQWEEIFNHLNKRQNILESFTISGGEATLQPLEEICEIIKQNYNLKIGLHTCGIYPQKIEKLLNKNLINWIGLDIKAPPKHYPAVTGRTVNFYKKVIQTLKIIKEHEIPYELRSTVHPSYVNKNFIEDLEKTGDFTNETLVLQKAQSYDDVEYEWTERENIFLELLKEEAKTINIKIR